MNLLLIIQEFTGEITEGVSYAIAWVPLIGLAISAASSGYSAYKKNKASNDLRNSQRDVLNRSKSLADYYQSEANKDFFDTDAARGAVDRLTKQYKDSVKKSADKVSKSGATQESKVATKASYLDKYNQALSNIAGYGANYKNNMNKSYEGVLKGLYSGNDTVYGRDVQSYGNLQNNSFNALSQSLGQFDLKESNDEKEGGMMGELGQKITG